MASFFDLIEQLQTQIDLISALAAGRDNETIIINGEERASVAKAIKDNFLSLQAMMQGRVPFTSLPELNADLNYDEDTLAEVWNDPVETNNGLYGKVGATGEGQWVKSPYDIIQQTQQIAQHVNALYEDSASNDLEHYIMLVVDSLGNIIESVDREFKRKSHAKFTFDSMEGNEVAKIDEISEVKVSADGYVLALVYQGSTDSVSNIDEISEVTINAQGYVVSFSYSSPVTDGNLPEINIAQSLYSSEGVRECTYTWWTYPMFTQFNNCVLGGGVGRKDPVTSENGFIKVWAQDNQGPMVVTSIGRQLDTTSGGVETGVDDHNPPAILLDPRENAEFPLTVFQTDHGIGNAINRMWRSRTHKIEDLELVGQISDMKKCTYSQVFRNPFNLDEILLITRSSDVDTSWFFLKSQDNGDTWTKKPVFIRDAAALYIGTKPGDDCVWISFQTHPLRGSSQDLMLAKYNWDDGSITQPNGTEWINDVWALNAPVDPLLGGPLKVFEAIGDEHTRLMDVLETAPGEIQLCWIEFDENNMRDNVYKLAVIDTATHQMSVRELGEGGNDLSNTSWFAYFAGACIVDQNRVVKAVYDGPNNLMKTEMFLMEWDGNTYQQKLIARKNNELYRPTPVSKPYIDNGQLKIRNTFTIAYLDGVFKEYYSHETIAHTKTFDIEENQ